MQARVISPVHWSKPHSLLAPTQDSNPDGRIQNHKQWPLHYHCTLRTEVTELIACLQRCGIDVESSDSSLTRIQSCWTRSGLGSQAYLDSDFGTRTWLGKPRSWRFDPSYNLTSDVDLKVKRRCADACRWFDPVTLPSFRAVTLRLDKYENVSSMWICASAGQFSLPGTRIRTRATKTWSRTWNRNLL